MDCDRDLQTFEAPLMFAQRSSTDRSVREASVAAAKRISQFEVDVAMRKDVFDRLCAFNDAPGAEDIGSEYKRFVEQEILKGKRNGT